MSLNVNDVRGREAARNRRESGVEILKSISGGSYFNKYSFKKIMD